MVYDWTDNSKRLLHPDDERLWSLDESTAQGAGGDPPVFPSCKGWLDEAETMRCDTVVHPRARACSYCGNEPVCESSVHVGMSIPVYPYNEGDFCAQCDEPVTNAVEQDYWFVTTPMHGMVKRGYAPAGVWVSVRPLRGRASFNSSVNIISRTASPVKIVPFEISVTCADRSPCRGACTMSPFR